MTEQELAEIEAVLTHRHSVLPLAVHDGFEEEEYEDGDGGWVTEHHRYHALRGRCRVDDAMTPGSYEVGRVHSAAAGHRIATLANAAPALVAEVRRLRAALAPIMAGWDREAAGCDCRSAATVLRREWMDAARAALDGTGAD